ncbi:hypothetical protein CkaCkLH20_02437 [Colletotrichum karsti]|uniref:Uncharacterized protein n=1 Tax=Colletotrichum karsti TaxID=1095194 RepID=A0A9P6LNZ2_9PEZI|nr:uncharacterized protein CkaCkLH20_02437 [Colletotrichum karsti]KAF9880483.1 hypothetical protein CkaCkLH20_02437 [Colletotrichum karsti]
MDYGVNLDDHYKYLKTLIIVRIVLTAVVVIPVIFFFVKLLRTPGYRHDTTRRWVDYTTAGFGLWALVHIALIIAWGFQIPTIDWSMRWDGGDFVRVGYRIIRTFLNIETWLTFWLHIATFLALFYMAHALTLLRTGSEPDSSAFRKGRGFALGGSIFAVLMSFTIFCLDMSISYTNYSSDSDAREMRRLVGTIFVLTCQAILLVMAISSVVYSAKSRKKARGTAVQQSGLILVVCSSLFLVRQVWELLALFFGGRNLTGSFMATFFVDLVFGSYLDLVILVLLYILATKASYSMSKVQYRSKVSTENLDA